LLAEALLVLVAAGAGAWWFRPPRLTPPMPADIQDEEVREAVLKARQPVFDHPGSAEAWGHLAKVLLAQQFDREADVCLAEANRLDPGDPRWLYARCIIGLKRDPDNAVTKLREAVVVANRSSFAIYHSSVNLLLADALVERRRFDEAEELYRTEELERPGNPRVAFGLGLIAMARGNDQAAAEFLAVAQACPYSRKNATGELARLALRRGDREAATRYSQTLAKLPGDSPWPDPLLDEIASMAVGPRGWERQVKWLEQARKHAEAIQVYLKWIERYPSADAYVGAGSNYSALRDYDHALPYLREAVRLEPNSAHARYWIALVLFARAERAWEQTPGAPHVIEWLQEGLPHAEMAAKLRPGHAQSYLIWGQTLRYLGRAREAIEPLRMGITCDTSNPELQLALGEVLLECDRLDEARTYLTNAQQLKPADPRPASALKRLAGRKAGK
jgi:tetratricopeptide (TPR) repeat protein